MCSPAFTNKLSASFPILAAGTELIRSSTQSNIVYTALGDSIAFGTGATNNYGYVSYLRDFMKSKNNMITFKNFSHPGMTSSDLLNQIMSKQAIRQSIADSNIITISIGGNNLLKSASKSYNHIDDNLAAIGISQFTSDWTNVLEELRNNINYSGIICVMTIYNPCRTNDPKRSVFSGYLGRINSAITGIGLIESYGYYVADVYSHFEINSQKNWTHFYNVIPNPHPNNEGYRQIFLMHQALVDI